MRQSELDRALAVVDALRHSDWERFCSLSAERFLNVQSMKEQFMGIAGAVEFAWKTIEESNYAARTDRKTRVIRIYLRNTSTRKTHDLILMNKFSKEQEKDKISILAVIPDMSEYFGVVKH